MVSVKHKSKSKSKSKNRYGYRGNPFLKYSRINRRDRKYCSCLMIVRHQNPKVNPYAICNKSIYKDKGLKRKFSLDCGVVYDLDKYKLTYLQSYAKERNIPYHGLTKKKLIRKLRDSIIKTKVKRSRKSRLLKRN